MINGNYDFQSFLQNQKQFNPNSIPFMVKRVYDCYRFLDIPHDRLLTPENIKRYLDHLTKITKTGR